MRSLIITLIIGTVMIGGSILYTSHLSDCSEQLSDIAEKIEYQIKKDDFGSANKFIKKLNKEVDKFEKFFLATGDHLEMDNIKINISELKSFSEHKQKSDALSKVYVLQFLFEHLPHNNRIRIGNIL